MLSEKKVINYKNLPEPDVLAMPGYEDVLAENNVLFGSLLPDYTPLDSDPYQLLLQSLAYRELHLRQTFNNKLKRSMLLFATGSDLDNEAARYNVVRLEEENDDVFLERILMSLDGFSTAGSLESYEFHARSVSSRIDDAHAYSPVKGTVNTVIASFSEPLDEALRQQTEEVLNGDKVRPVTDTANVLIAEERQQVIEAEIELFNPDQQAAVEQKIRENFKLQLRIAANLTYSQIIRYLHVEGVYKAVLNNISGDIECEDHQILRISELNLSFKEADYA